MTETDSTTHVAVDALDDAKFDDHDVERVIKNIHYHRPLTQRTTLLDTQTHTVCTEYTIFKSPKVAGLAQW